MVKRKVLRGVVVLAATAAAALTACGDNGETDAGGGNGGEGSDSDGDSDAGNSGGRSSGGQASTGGSGDDGGNAGNGGQGGAPQVEPPTAAELVAMYCAPLVDDGNDPVYTIIEGDDQVNSYGELYIGEPTAYVTYGDEDSVSIVSDNSEGIQPPVQACYVAGPGDDFVYLFGYAAGTNSANDSGSVVALTVAGGKGADTLSYEVQSYGEGSTPAYSDYRPPFVFKDYEAGVDSVSIDGGNAFIDTTAGDNGVVVYETNFTSSTLVANFSSTQYVVVVDATDGQIWLAQNNEGTAYNWLIGTLQGDSVDPDDVTVTVVPPPV